MSFNITGTGSAHPRKVVTNEDLTHFLDTSDEWIRTRTGIEERRVLSDESLLDLAVEAAENALSDADIDASDLDLILFSTLQGDYATPSMSCLLAKRLGATTGRMLDINMACSGFLYALDAADAYFQSGKVKKALIIAAEAMSMHTDWTDRSTCVLFGDGAGAVVLEAGDGLKDMLLEADGDARHLYIPARRGNSPYAAAVNEEQYLYMDGHEIYIFAVSTVVKRITEILERNNLEPDATDFYLLHQANTRILDSARRKLKQPAEKFPQNLHRYGNTSSASIPMLLDEMNREGKLHAGQKIVICSFGAGLTSAACLINWKKG